jgi:hypothetical protein
LSAIATITRSNALLAPRGRQASRKPQSRKDHPSNEHHPKTTTETVHRHPQITALIAQPSPLKMKMG